MKNAFTQPVWNFSKYNSEKNYVSSLIICRKQKHGMWKEAGDMAHHHPVSEYDSGMAALALTHPGTLGSAVQALLPLGHSQVLLQPWSLHSIWHVKHLCSMCLSWDTTCGPPGTCSWDRTQLLLSTQGALSEATVQEHPHAWQEVAPALNLGLVQCSWEEPYLPHHAEGTDNWLHNIFRCCKTQSRGKENSRTLS